MLPMRFRAKSAHHLFDIRHMNVGITRARRKLLVGASSTLCRHPFFVELLAYVKGVGGYRTAQELAREQIAAGTQESLTQGTMAL